MVNYFINLRLLPKLPPKMRPQISSSCYHLLRIILNMKIGMFGHSQTKLYLSRSQEVVTHSHTLSCQIYNRKWHSCWLYLFLVLNIDPELAHPDWGLRRSLPFLKYITKYQIMSALLPSAPFAIHY